MTRRFIRFLEDEYAQVRNEGVIDREVFNNILAEAGKLSDEERRIVEQYPNIAEDDELEELNEKADDLVGVISNIPISGGKRKTRKRKTSKRKTRKARKTKQRR